MQDTLETLAGLFLALLFSIVLGCLFWLGNNSEADRIGKQFCRNPSNHTVMCAEYRRERT
jgi:hypothetical protein